MRRPTLSLWRSTQGNSFVEMALVAPLLTSLLLGTVDISRAVSAKLQIEQAAQRTVELVQRSEFKESDKATLKAEAVTAADVPASDVAADAWHECNGVPTTNYDDACNAGQVSARYFSIQIRKDFMPTFGSRFFPGANADGSYTLISTAGVRVQ